jgi:hypothetical protein
MPSQAMRWTGRVLSAIPVLLLLFSASMKLVRNPQAVEGMVHFGYPPNTLLPIGVTELTCTLLYIFPRTSVLGAVLLTGYLGGAVATHVRAGEPQFVMAIILGICVWLGLWLREERLRALVPLRS